MSPFSFRRKEMSERQRDEVIVNQAKILVLPIFNQYLMSNSFQQTIRKEASLAGVGLHTGKKVTVRFVPAAANHGIKFQRVDLTDQPVIPADCDLVTTVQRGTTLEKGSAAVSTVEHLMSALVGLQIDNCLVQIDGIEVPIMDGSAKYFVEAIEKAGIQEQSEERDVFEIRQNIHYVDKD